MAYTFNELIDSRELTASNNATEKYGILRFNVYESDKIGNPTVNLKLAHDFVKTYLQATFPVFPGDAAGNFDDYPFTGRFRLNYVGNQEFFGEAYYSASEIQLDFITWNISSGQELITRSNSVRYRRQNSDNASGAGVPGTAPEIQNAIGWDGKSVKGVNVPSPIMEFTITNRQSPLAITQLYMQTLRDAVGRVNSLPFIGFAAYEVMFMGAGGRQVSHVDDLFPYEIAFNFIARKNQTDLFIGVDTTDEIKLPDVRAWEHVDVVYQQREISDSVVPIPKFAYVHDVAKVIDFGSLDIITDNLFA